MVNPLRGDVEITLDDQVQVMRLTLGSLVTLEAEVGSILELVERFEAGNAHAQDVLAVLFCGLQGHGWDGQSEELRQAHIDGGYVTAVQKAAELLSLSFGGGHD